MKSFRCEMALLLLAACCAASPAGAQGEGGNPANWCRNGAFTRDAEAFGLARVKGLKGSRVHFYGEEEGCPGPDAKRHAPQVTLERTKIRLHNHGMSEEATHNLPDSRSFEERVFARFDAFDARFDARLYISYSRARETKQA